MREDIEEQILSKAILRGNNHYYEYQDAIELVEICHENGLRILGIDSFIVTERKTQPFMEHSIDLSDSKDSYKTAKDFLNLKKIVGLFLRLCINIFI